MITTNQFDTLLDKNNESWMRVIDDIDLSEFNSEKSNTQLIYFHGHRCQPKKWVFTQNQYEDIFSTRPRIVTRIRQLFSMNPVLIVGYSLFDPDFHHIYRQVSKEMRKYNPVGLAILLKEPHAAEKTHWEKLGLKIVVAKLTKSMTYSDWFEKFFAINPDHPDFQITPSKFIGDSENIAGFQKRLSYFGDALSDKYRRNYINNLSTFDEAEKMWLAVVEPEFTEEEWNNSITTRTVANWKKLRKLPSDRFKKDSEICRIVDGLLKINHDNLKPVSDWLSLALNFSAKHSRKHLPQIAMSGRYKHKKVELSENDQSGSESILYTILDLLSWVTRERAINKNINENIDYEELFRGYFLVAKDEDFSDLRDIILDDIRKAGFEDKMPDAVVHDDRYLQFMKKGYEAYLNDEIPEYKEYYEEALTLAKQQSDSFREWLALRGARGYVKFGEESYSSRDEKSDIEIRTLFKEIQNRKTVKRWLKNAEKKRLELWKMTAEEYEREKNERQFGDRTRVFGATVRNYWKLFRELELNFSHPNQQKEFIQPLLKANAFDPMEELEYRLTLEKKDISNFLQKFVSRLEPYDLDKRTKQDNKLVNLVLDTPEKNKRWLWTSIEAVSGLDYLIERKDLKPILELLQKAKDVFKDDRYLAFRLPNAWQSYSHLEDYETFFPKWEEYCNKLKPETMEAERFCSAFLYIPWQNWINEDKSRADRLLKFVLKVDKDLNVSDLTKGHRGEQGIISALDDITRTAEESSLAPELIKQVHEFIDDVFSLKPDMSNWQSYYSAYRIKLDTESEDTLPEIYDSILTSLKKLFEENNQTGDHNPYFQYEFSSAMATEGLQAIYVNENLREPLEEKVKEIVDFTWERLLENNEKILQHFELNSHLAYSFLNLCVEIIKTESTSPRAESARIWLLKLIDSNSQIIPMIAKTLVPDCWHEQRGEVIGKIYRAAGGNKGKDSMENVISAIGLLYNLQNIKSQEFPVEFNFLKETAYLGISSDNEIIANYSAFAVINDSLDVQDSFEVDRTIAAIKQISLDPRVAVRMAAAFGAAKGKTEAKSVKISKFYETVYDKMQKESYFHIQQQIKSGLEKSK